MCKYLNTCNNGDVNFSSVQASQFRTHACVTSDMNEEGCDSNEEIIPFYEAFEDATSIGYEEDEDVIPNESNVMPTLLYL